MIVVLNSNDSGAGSLRQAILDAASGEEITFDSGVTSISLLSELLINKNLIITGPGSGALSIDGNGAFRVFNVNVGVVSISGMSILFAFGAQGGAIHNEATLTLSDVIVDGAISTDEGGGIWNSSTINPTNVTVQNCACQAGNGGGIFSTGTITGNNVMVANNSAAGHGGGVYNEGTFTQTGGSIAGNSSQTGSQGGGVHNAGTLALTEVTLSGNSGENGGGIYNSLGTTVNLVRCTVSGNFAINLYNDAGTMGLVNCTVSPSGLSITGIVNSFGSLDVRHCTIVGHQFGIFNDYPGGSSLVLYNTILSGNDTNDYEGRTADVTSEGHNILGNDFFEPITEAAGDQRVLVYADLFIGDLQNNGGPTFTHALLEDSPAVNAGDNTDAPATDQRGETRIKNTTIDIGAYESDFGGEEPPEPPDTPPPTPTDPLAEPCVDASEVSAETTEACTPEPNITPETIAPCNPLTQLPKLWSSTQSCTAVCPEGTFGSPVTKTVTASSDISQADADAKAMALACEAAEQELVCNAISIIEEEASLEITLLGEYDLQATEEEASLLLALLGEYAIEGLEDDALLEITLEGDYILVPFIEESAVVLGLSPVSSYIMNALIDRGILQLSMTGNYFTSALPPQVAIENASLALSLLGTYIGNIVSQTKTENASLVATMSGAYVLRVILTTATESASLVTTLSGDYVFRIIPISRTETASLNVSLSGTYA